MRKLVLLLAVVAIVYGLDFFQERGLSVAGISSTSQDSNSVVRAAFKNRQSGIQVQGQGTVSRVLPDDIDGSGHQRFILEIGAGQTVLIAHNIDLAPGIAKLNKGDLVEFFGEYEWNAKGGVIHWTHRDPNYRHIDGWLKHRDRIYQ